MKLLYWLYCKLVVKLVMEDGLYLFNEMESNYGIRPVIEYFACMVDLLGRARLLPKTTDFINGKSINLALSASLLVNEKR